MVEIAHLNSYRELIDLDFVERERTPGPAMALGLQSHVVGLSLSNTVEFLDSLGVQRSRKAIYDWVQKADLQPESGKSPNQIVLDETVILAVRRCRAAIERTVHVRLFATTTTTLTEICPARTRQKHNVETTAFLVDGTQHLQTALQRVGHRFRMCHQRNWNTIERIFRELRRRARRFRTASATSNRKQPKIGCRVKPAGTMLLKPLLLGCVNRFMTPEIVLPNLSVTTRDIYSSINAASGSLQQDRRL